MEKNSPSKPNVGNFHVTTLSHEEIYDLVLKKVNSDSAFWLLTLNWQIISLSYLDKNYRSLLSNSDLICADGQTVFWISKLSNDKVKSLTIGYYLTEKILKSDSKIPIAVIGGSDHKKISDLLEGYGNLNSYVFCEKYEGTKKQKEFLYQKIQTHKSKIVFVALGVPKQDDFCAYLKSTGFTGVCIGVGGSFEILIGNFKKIPFWAHRAGIAWLIRLLRDPLKLSKRYLLLYPIGLIFFVFKSFMSLLREK